MKLQVKELKIPEFFEIEGIDGSVAVDSNENAESHNFACVFNRNLESGESGSLTVKLYTEEGTEIEDYTLTFTNNDASEESLDTIYFELLAPENYGDDEVYVHAYIDDTNSIVFEANSSIQEATIKKIFFRANPEITNFYWSFTENIEQGDQDDSKRTQEDEICRNEDAFLHIKGKGLKNQEIIISILEDDTWSDDELFMDMKVTMESNITSISLKMSDIIAKYKLLHSTVGLMFEGDDLEVKARVKIVTVDEISETDLLHLKHEKDAKQPIKSTNTGLVITLQGDVENTAEEQKEIEENTTEYTDFEIGLVAELKSSGRIDQAARGNLVHSAVIVYPFNFYTLRLKNLVDSGIITTDEARQITLNPNTSNTLYSAEEMINRFNKYKLLGEVNTSIIQRLADDSNPDIVSASKVKKVLDLVKASFTAPDRIYHVCRDGWQTGASATNVRPIERYYKNGGECPPGGHTLNYLVNNYDVYFSNLVRNSNNSEIKVGTHPTNRGGLAIHQGCSYFATGCTTLNTEFKTSERQDIISYLFNGASLMNSTQANTINRKRLIMVLIEERNANITSNYKSRWHDPVLAPGSIIREIIAPITADIQLGHSVEFSLRLGKQTVENYTVPKEEKAHIRWKYQVSGLVSERAIPNSDGRERCSLTIDEKWSGKSLIVKSYVALWMAGTIGIQDTPCINDQKQITVVIPKAK